MTEACRADLPDAVLRELKKQHPNEFEYSRAVQMAKNKLEMNRIGLGAAVEDLHQAKAEGQTSRKPRAPAPPRAPAEKLRTSARAATLPKPNYKGMEPQAEGAVRPAKGKKTGRRSGTREGGEGPRRRNLNAGWQPEMGTASASASNKSDKAAQERETKLHSQGRVASWKEMSESQVSGGCWNQLPAAFAKQFVMVHSKKTLHLDPGAAMAYKPSEVIFQPKGTGAGFSGGWRGFVQKTLLYPNDAVVYEKMDEDNVRMHLFRAYNYDSDFVGVQPLGAVGVAKAVSKSGSSRVRGARGNVFKPASAAVLKDARKGKSVSVRAGQAPTAGSKRKAPPLARP